MQLLLYNRLGLPIAILMVACLFCITPTVAMAGKSQPKLKEHWRARIRDDKMTEAFQAAKEITEYLNKKYPSLSGRLYIEKTVEFTAIHWFADYENMDSFKRIASQLGTDEEFLSMMKKK